MGLFSKLFGGDKDAEKAVRDLFKGLVNEAQKQENAPKPAAETPAPAAAPSAVHTASAASNDPYGEEMPAEPNQYNFNGTYVQYFEGIFQTEFPAYRLTKETPKYSKGTIFTFWNGDAKALVVELLPSSSDAKKLRKICRGTGVPYLRYYYDANDIGWWNIRSYVVERTRKALNG